MVIKSLKLTTRPKYIFNKCETNIYFFTLHRFAPSPSLNFRLFFSPKLFSERFGKYVNLPLEHVYHVFSFRSLHTPGHNSPYPGTLALQTLSSQLSKQTIDFLFFITFSQFSRLGSWLCAKRKNDGVCI